MLYVAGGVVPGDAEWPGVAIHSVGCAGGGAVNVVSQLLLGLGKFKLEGIDIVIRGLVACNVGKLECAESMGMSRFNGLDGDIIIILGLCSGVVC